MGFILCVELWVVLVDELNEFVAINPLEIALCEREIPGSLVEASGWYCEQRLPEGRKNYTKTAPIQFEEFAPCISWWKKREETPVRYLTWRMFSGIEFLRTTLASLR